MQRVADAASIDNGAVELSCAVDVSMLSELDALLLHTALLIAIAARFRPKTRREPSHFQQRLNWKRCSSQHAKHGTFQRRLRMPKASFDNLLELLRPRLTSNEEQASNRGGSTIPEVSLHCTLRWLAGGSHLDVIDIAGISKSSFYRILWRTMFATCLCEELDVVFPETAEQVDEACRGFASVSWQESTINCATVIDGFLFRIATPPKAAAGNVRSFFSGHCQCHGVNMQAGVDHHSRFTFISFAAPGVTQDRVAAHRCSLSKLIESLPIGVCAIADAACDPTEHMVPVCCGVDRKQPMFDNFNFYASQLRMRAEMAFGIVTRKWGVLQRPRTANLSNASRMMQAIARLHNYVVTERLNANGTSQDEEAARAHGSSHLPSVPEDENGDPIRLDATFTGSFAGHSELRQRMAERVKRLQLTRPASNKLS